MADFPPILEKILFQHLSKKHASGTFSDLLFFSRGAKKLSTAFTSERGTLPTDYLNDPVLRSGYLVYFLPINYLKMVQILKPIDPEIFPEGKIRILDVGCGPGTNMLAMMTYFSELLVKKKKKDIWLDFTLLDRSYSSLRDAFSLHDAYRAHLEKKCPGFRSICSIKTYDLRRTGVHRFLRKFRYDIISASNVLNELPKLSMRVALLAELLGHNLAKQGRMILIEPALQKTARDLQRIRDELVVENKCATVEAPCLHQEICPLNQINLRDWCHFYLSWEMPKFIEELNQIIGRKNDWLKMAYLVLKPVQKIRRDPFQWRVISNGMKSQGKREIVLCGPQGRSGLMRLDRDASRKNAELEKMQRGDLVGYIPKEAGYAIDAKERIGKDDAVRILQKF